MEWVIPLVYVLGYPFAVFVIAGLAFSDFQSIWKGDPTEARKHARHNCGGALFIGFFGAIAWPLFVPAAFLFSGFGGHGLWKDFTK